MWTFRTGFAGEHPAGGEQRSTEIIASTQGVDTPRCCWLQLASFVRNTFPTASFFVKLTPWGVTAQQGRTTVSGDQGTREQQLSKLPQGTALSFSRRKSLAVGPPADFSSCSKTVPCGTFSLGETT